MQRALSGLVVLGATMVAGCTDSIHLVSPAGGPVRAFRVVLADAETGEPIAGAQVRLTPAAPADTSRLAGGLSAPSGEVVLTDLEPGRYHMLVRRIGYAPERREVELGGAPVATLAVPLRLAPVCTWRTVIISTEPRARAP